VTAANIAPDIAIVGMAGRFPGARDVGEYWDNLRAGVESITFFSHAELTASRIDPALLNRRDYVRAAPVLDDPSLFDAAFFGYTPYEAEIIDPQHRLFLECAWTALEHAGYDPGRNDRPVGVFGGSAINSYLLFGGSLQRFADDYVLTLTGSDKDFLATRVSYKLNLTGPSMTVQTACSTSLVCVHLAKQSLLDGECDMALAGGVAVRVPHRAGHLHVDGGILSADGHCRPFDADASGTIFGSGAGVVVLKRLADAMADGDTVHAVIKGSAINNDGAAKANYSAPSVARQAAAIAEALADADADPATISYVETHGTGTRVGDPIEIAALTQAFGDSKTGYCAIGSVKSNIGHLDAAAGVAGLIKTVLALRHGEIPASLHFRRPNPEIGFERTPFRVNDRLSPWSRGRLPRRAAVNALGVGGTNAHVILEEAPSQPASCPSRSAQLLLLSAKTATALTAATSSLAEHLVHCPDDELADVAYTLQVGRRPFGHRRAVLCRGRDAAVERLRTLSPHSAWTARCPADARKIVFIVPGQGTQRASMGIELYRTEPVFRAEIDRCAELFAPHLSADLRDILYPGDERLDQTCFAQPALFTISCALAALWSSWGLKPAALLGHSIGELIAACLAGVFSLEDAVQVVAARGLLMQQLPAGAMLAVQLPEAELSRIIDGDLALAAVNGPSQSVVAGKPETVRELMRQCGKRSVATHLLPVSRAFHSAMMDPIVEPFLRHVRRVRLRPPAVPFVSNVTGTWIKPEEATDPEYWARQLRHTVRLAASFRTLAAMAEHCLLEVGPGQSLCNIARQQTCSAVAALPSLLPPNDTRTELEGLMSTLGRLWLAGADIDWAGFAAGERRRRVPLPTYPFERQCFWITPIGAAPSFAVGTPAPNVMPASAEPSQQRLTAERETSMAGSAGQPRTATEAAVLSVWKAVLGDIQIGVSDNFYSLGGHSLMIPNVVRRLSTTFGIDLPLVTLMEAPTVTELAERIDDIFRIRDEAASLAQSRRQECATLHGGTR
jgi:phthiocerol/phenolphthiocerol synthesis type-I polyketide synthase E